MAIWYIHDLWLVSQGTHVAARLRRLPVVRDTVVIASFRVWRRSRVQIHAMTYNLVRAFMQLKAENTINIIFSLLVLWENTN
jgi:hypothetical protein